MNSVCMCGISFDNNIIFSSLTYEAICKECSIEIIIIIIIIIIITLIIIIIS